jgi:hypothetical protein
MVKRTAPKVEGICNRHVAGGFKYGLIEGMTLGGMTFRASDSLFFVVSVGRILRAYSEHPKLDKRVAWRFAKSTNKTARTPL